MRMPLIVQPRPSPLAQTFSDLSRAYMSGPSREERDYRDALAQKTRMEVEQLQSTQSALKEAPSTLASIFSSHVAGGVPAEEFVGPAPETGLVPEAPNNRAERVSTGLAELFTRVGEDNAKNIMSGLTAGQAFGSPDDMRRSMALQGKNIDEDFAPTGAVADAVAQRNSDLETEQNLAKPRSESEIKGEFLRKNFDSLDTLNPYQRKALDAEPNQGMALTMGPDGSVTYSSGGAKMPSSVISDAVGNTDSANALLSTVNELRGLNLKPEDFGLIGSARDLAQGAAGQVSALQNWSAGKQNIIADEIAANPALFSGFNYAEWFDPSLPQKDLLMHTLAYEYAKMLDPDGRISDADVRNAKAAIGGGMFDTLDAFNARLPLIEKRGKGIIDRNANRVPGGAAPVAGPPVAAPAMPAGENPAIAAARAAIAKGKSRDHVLQRLRQNGIEPPPDL